MLTSMAEPRALTTFFGDDECQLVIARLSQSRVLVVLEGRDVGQLGRAPFTELDKTLDAGGPVDLFFDLRSARSATMDVSGSWALWLRANAGRLRHVGMLTSRPLIRLSAKSVHSFSQLGEKLHLYSDAAAFESALRAA
jgi:hypothetical protein